jgi:hypothetical protein
LSNKSKIQGIQAVYQHGADENMEFFTELGLDQRDGCARKSA